MAKYRLYFLIRVTTEDYLFISKTKLSGLYLTNDIQSSFRYNDTLSDDDSIISYSIESDFVNVKKLQKILVDNASCVSIFQSVGCYSLCPMTRWKLHWVKYHIGLD